MYQRNIHIIILQPHLQLKSFGRTNGHDSTVPHWWKANYAQCNYRQLRTIPHHTDDRIHSQLAHTPQYTDVAIKIHHKTRNDRRRAIRAASVRILNSAHNMQQQLHERQTIPWFFWDRQFCFQISAILSIWNRLYRVSKKPFLFVTHIESLYHNISHFFLNNCFDIYQRMS